MSIIFLCISIAILVLGIVLIVVFKNRKKKKLKTYSYKVNARIVGAERCGQVESQLGSSPNVGLYSPVYEYYYGGRYYTVVSKIPSAGNGPQVGSYKEIYINPEKPDEIYEPAFGDIIPTLGVVGGIFIVVSSIGPVLISLFILIACIDFEFVSSGIDNIIAKLDPETFTDIVMVFVLGDILLYAAVIIACIVVVCVILSKNKKKKERCESRVPVSFKPATIKGSTKLEYVVNGYMHTKIYPSFLCSLILRLNLDDGYIYVNPKKPTETFHAGISRIISVVVIIVAVIISLVALSKISGIFV